MLEKMVCGGETKVLQIRQQIGDCLGKHLTAGWTVYESNELKRTCCTNKITVGKIFATYEMVTC